MFTRLVQWIREALRRMIGQSDIKQKLNVDVLLSSDMSIAIDKWTRMYTNQASWLDKDVRSLGLPAAIAQELARMLTIEMKIEVTGGSRATWLQEQYDTIAAKLPEFVEYGCAKGSLIMKPYVFNGRIAIDFVHADQFLPVAFDSSGHITAIVFVDQKQVGEKYFTRMEYHRMIGNYTHPITGRPVLSGVEIMNRAFQSDDKSQLGNAVSLSVLPEWKDLTPEVTFHDIDRPLYGYFRYPLANHIDTASPLGVSAYSRADELIEDADRQYGRYKWEYEGGEMALYADDTAFGLDSSGKPKLPNKRLYRNIHGTANIGEGKLFEAWAPQLRDEALNRGLQVMIQKIEFNCGLAYGTISDPQMIEKTATEIASAKQRLQSTVKNGQKALRTALDQLFYAMNAYADIYKLAQPGTYTVTQNYDDSLITDKDAQRMQDRQDVTLGVMPKYRYLMDTRGLTEAEAMKWIAEAQNEQPADFFKNEPGV